MSSFWLTLKQQWPIKISSPLFPIFSLAAILVGSRDHRTQFWKGAIQGPFHQSLAAIGPVVSEEKIKMWNVDGWTTDDGRKVMTIAHMAKRPGELKTDWWMDKGDDNIFKLSFEIMGIMRKLKKKKKILQYLRTADENYRNITRYKYI
jgi:hypothetical protein